ncbi:MAG: tetratricopeptide repeat protein [Pseudomonadota bacterium]
MSLLKRLFGRDSATPRPTVETPEAPDEPVGESLDALFLAGREKHERGDLDGAVTCYQAILEKAEYAPALNLLGVASAQRGDVVRAVELVDRSLTLEPDNPEAHANRGNILRMQERGEEAGEAYRRALALDPTLSPARRGLAEMLSDASAWEDVRELLGPAIANADADAYEAYMHGNAASALDDEAEAVRSFEAALAELEAFPEAHHNLAVVLTRIGQRQHDEAVLGKAHAHYQRALALRPDFADGHFNYGQLLEQLGDYPRAESAYVRALEIFPQFLLARRRLGHLLLKRDDGPGALTQFDEVLADVPDSPDAWVDRGLALESVERTGEAREAYEKAMGIDPEHARAKANLGTLVAREGALEEGALLLEDAIRIDDASVESWSNLGGVRQMQAELGLAASHYERALALAPNAIFLANNRVSLHNYAGDVAPEMVLAAHQTLADALRGANGASARDALAGPAVSVTGRRLRVGYVSADFRTHSVAYFFEPLLNSHDRERFEVFGVSNVSTPDAITERLKSRFDAWIDIAPLDDLAAAQAIAAAQIDILVDLSGYSAGHRLGVFAFKPAPVQMTYLGYPNTTGMPEVDYRIVDDVTDPPGVGDTLMTETPLRLSAPFLTYQPPMESLVLSYVRKPPAQAPFTFASFNELLKMTPEVVAAWSRILHEIPESILLLKGSALSDVPTQVRIGARFAEHGIGAERLRLLGRTDSLSEHLGLYAQVDLALDTFPYNGTTTTCEALWMEVPVLTLGGERHAGRVGETILRALGEPTLIAGSVDDYVAAAIELARAPSRIEALSATLRERMSASPLMAHTDFTGRLEQALLETWEHHVGAG